MITSTAPTLIASNVNVYSGQAADLQNGDEILHGTAHVMRIVRNLRTFMGRRVFDAHKRDYRGEYRMGEWTLAPDADVLIMRPQATRYGVNAVITRRTDAGTITSQLPYFELNANVQGITSEDGARNVALAIVADIAGVTRTSLSWDDEPVTASVTVAKLD